MIMIIMKNKKNRSHQNEPRSRSFLNMHFPLSISLCELNFCVIVSKTYGRTYGRTDIQMVGYTDGGTDGQTDRPSYRDARMSYYRTHPFGHRRIPFSSQHQNATSQITTMMSSSTPSNFLSAK